MKTTLIDALSALDEAVKYEDTPFANHQETCKQIDCAKWNIRAHHHDAEDQAVEAIGFPHQMKETLALLVTDPMLRKQLIEFLQSKAIDALAEKLHSLRCFWEQEYAKLTAMRPERCLCYACNRIGKHRPDGSCTFCYEEKEARRHDKIINRGISSALSRARSLGLPATLSQREWNKTLEHFNNACAYCGEEWYEVEHILSMNKGGGTIWANCLPACRSCNVTKLSADLHEIAGTWLRPKKMEAILEWLVKVNSIVHPDDQFPGDLANALSTFREGKK